VNETVLLALGANLPSSFGPPDVTICLAAQEFADAGLSDITMSRLFRTPAFPPGSGPDYVNAAVCGKTCLTPARLLVSLQALENRFGRERGHRWGARTLDIDILAIGERVLPDLDTFRHWLNLPGSDQMQVVPDDLILPHPRLQSRGFVLVPLADVAPDWHHPVLGQSVTEMLAGLPEADRADIKPLANP